MKMLKLLQIFWKNLRIDVTRIWFIIIINFFFFFFFFVKEDKNIIGVIECLSKFLFDVARI